MATQVTITIDLDAGGALAGLERFKSSAADLGSDLEDSGDQGADALDGVTQGLGSMGLAAQAASGETQNALLQMNQKAGQAAGVYRTIWGAAEDQRVQDTAGTNDQIERDNAKLAQQLGSGLESAYNALGSGKTGQSILASMKKLFFQILSEWLLTTGAMQSSLGGIFGAFGSLGSLGSSGSFESPALSSMPSIAGQAVSALGGGSLNPLGVLSALPLLGRALGGNLGMLGAAVPLFAALNPLGLAGGLLGSGLGIGLGGALLGFGVGENHGAAAGAVAGGLGGAGIGSLLGGLAGFGALGGPVGLAVAGIVGVIGGIFGGLFGGSKRRREANDYFTNQVRPAIAKIDTEFKQFQLDGPAALDQLQQLDAQARSELKKLKSEGNNAYKKKVHPAILAEEDTINSLEAERTRRSGLVFGPAQFHDGGFVDVTRSNAQASANEMWALLQHGEFVVNAAATRNNLAGLHAINAGGSSGGGQSFSISDGAHFHFHSPNIDRAWLRNGGAQEIVDALRRWGNEGGV